MQASRPGRSRRSGLLAWLNDDPSSTSIFELKARLLNLALIQLTLAALVLICGWTSVINCDSNYYVGSGITTGVAGMAASAIAAYYVIYGDDITFAQTDDGREVLGRWRWHDLHRISIGAATCTVVFGISFFSAISGVVCEDAAWQYGHAAARRCSPATLSIFTSSCPTDSNLTVDAIHWFDWNRRKFLLVNLVDVLASAAGFIAVLAAWHLVRQAFKSLRIRDDEAAKIFDQPSLGDDLQRIRLLLRRFQEERSLVASQLPRFTAEGSREAGAAPPVCTSTMPPPLQARYEEGRQLLQQRRPSFKAAAHSSSSRARQPRVPAAGSIRLTGTFGKPAGRLPSRFLPNPKAAEVQRRESSRQGSLLPKTRFVSPSKDTTLEGIRRAVRKASDTQAKQQCAGRRGHRPSKQSSGGSTLSPDPLRAIDSMLVYKEAKTASIREDEPSCVDVVQLQHRIAQQLFQMISGQRLDLGEIDAAFLEIVRREFIVYWKQHKDDVLNYCFLAKESPQNCDVVGEMSDIVDGAVVELHPTVYKRYCDALQQMKQQPSSTSAAPKTFDHCDESSDLDDVFL